MLAVVAGSLSVGAAALRAQETLLPATSWGAAPIFSTWHFSTPIAQAAGAVTDVRQLALPLQVQFNLSDRWVLDFGGAAASSSVTVLGGGATHTLTLSGVSDVRVRVSGPIIGDAVRVTAGVNLPTGTVGLSSDETNVLQSIAAPALEMPVGALGLGLGGTLGLVAAREAGPWALAIGASAESRRAYTPIDLALAGAPSLMTLTPGSALHVTVGATRAVGESRLSLLAVADAYQKDALTTANGSGQSTQVQYTLGPQVSAVGRLDLALSGWREASSTLAVRYRAPFSDANGASVSGSGGSYVEAAFTGVHGATTGLGLLLGTDARYQTGLPFTSALVGAAVSAIGATLGVELPLRATVLRLAARGQFAHFDTGAVQSNGIGLSLVAAIAARAGAP